MLRELPKKSQPAGEPERRWFFSHEMDLILWMAADGKPNSFQLAYDKYRGEHLISWSAEKGTRHYAVDDGEAISNNQQTPLLHANGAVDAHKVLTAFCAEAIEVPAAIREFVEARLRELGTGG